MPADWSQRFQGHFQGFQMAIEQPFVSQMVHSVQLSAEGKVLRYLDDNDSSHVGTISAVTEAKDRLYLGNLGGNFVSYLSKGDLPPILAH